MFIFFRGLIRPFLCPWLSSTESEYLCSLAFCWRPDLSLFLSSTASECPLPLLTWFLSVSWPNFLCLTVCASLSLVHLLLVSWCFTPSALDSWWVPLVGSLSFCFQCPDLSFPLFSIASEYSLPPCSFWCPDLCLPPWSTVCRCPSFAHFLSVFWIVPPYVLNSEWASSTRYFFSILPDLSFPHLSTVCKSPLFPLLISIS